MGYELHITRRTDWFDEGLDITHEEWEHYVNSDPEMELEEESHITNAKGETIEIESEGLAIWTSPSDDSIYHFYRTNGNVSAARPDIHARKKMSKIASALNAKVQGDDCELYDENGEVIEGSNETVSSSSKSAWWQFWR